MENRHIILKLNAIIAKKSISEIIVKLSLKISIKSSAE